MNWRVVWEKFTFIYLFKTYTLSMISVIEREKNAQPKRLVMLIFLNVPANPILPLPAHSLLHQQINFTVSFL